MIRQVILAIFAATLTAQPTDKKAFRVLGEDNGEIILVPYTPPLLGVKQISGPEIPKNSSLLCEWKNQKQANTPVTVLVGYCEGGIVVRLVSEDLNH